MGCEAQLAAFLWRPINPVNYIKLL